MIQLIEASNFRSLKYVSQRLEGFHVLIGANATGKTTFLDVIKFMADIVNYGIDKAVYDRVSYFDELTFGGKGGTIELAIEVELPKSLRALWGNTLDSIRYAIQIGLISETGEIAVLDELLILLNRDDSPNIGADSAVIDSVFNKKHHREYRLVISKQSGNSFFYNEIFQISNLLYNFKLGNKKTALGNLPEDESQFPASTWLKSFLQSGIEPFILDSLHMRNPSSSGQTPHFITNGSNLPWIIEELKKDKRKFIQWIEHIQTALPDIEDVLTILREEDRKRYIKIKYKNGLEVPSWLVSDGTLRLLALTIPAYLRNLAGIFLVEEPENGIHPKAIETVFLSLSSVYNAQFLLASHSPTLLSLVRAEQLLCFTKTNEGATYITKGSNHPKLVEWKGSPNLSVLFASGILS